MLFLTYRQLKLLLKPRGDTSVNLFSRSMRIVPLVKIRLATHQNNVIDDAVVFFMVTNYTKSTCLTLQL